MSVFGLTVGYHATTTNYLLRYYTYNKFL